MAFDPFELLADYEFWEELAKRLESNNRKIWEVVEEAVELAYIAGERRTARDLGIPLSPGRLLAKQYLDKRGLQFVKGLTDTDIQFLKAAIEKHWGEGERRFAQALLDSDLASESRLRTIYRTEVHSAFENAGYVTAKDFGAVAKKWVAVMDERTRPEHAAVHGEVVPIDEPFSNGRMHAGEEINCRCRTVYLTELPEE